MYTFNAFLTVINYYHDYSKELIYKETQFLIPFKKIILYLSTCLIPIGWAVNLMHLHDFRATYIV